MSLFPFQLSSQFASQESETMCQSQHSTSDITCLSINQSTSPKQHEKNLQKASSTYPVSPQPIEY